MIYTLGVLRHRSRYYDDTQENEYVQLALSKVLSIQNW